jgi:RNA polymerase sigma-70 factor (ECF subfamily)
LIAMSKSASGERGGRPVTHRQGAPRDADGVVDFAPNRDAVDGVRRGDPASIAAIYDAFSGFVHALVYRQLGPSHAVEDLVQQVFLRVVREAPEYRSEAAFRSWIRQSTYFVVCRHLRGLRRHPEALGGIEVEDAIENGSTAYGANDGSADPERQLVDLQVRRRTWRLLDKMKPDKRMALVLHDFEGNTIDEGAHILGCARFAFRSRLARARREFAALAQKDETLMRLIDRGDS